MEPIPWMQVLHPAFTLVHPVPGPVIMIARWWPVVIRPREASPPVLTRDTWGGEDACAYIAVLVTPEAEA